MKQPVEWKVRVVFFSFAAHVRLTVNEAFSILSYSNSLESSGLGESETRPCVTCPDVLPDLYITNSRGIYVLWTIFEGKDLKN